MTEPMGVPMAGNDDGPLAVLLSVLDRVKAGDFTARVPMWWPEMPADADNRSEVVISNRGELLELKNTVNAMVGQLNDLTGEVTRVAREVGIDGRPGSTEVGGAWSGLTDTIDQLAATLTHQDWLTTNRVRFNRMLQGQRDLPAVAGMILSELARLVAAQHGVFYSVSPSSGGGEPRLRLEARYGCQERRHLSTSVGLVEGLFGRCATEKKPILLTEIPDDGPPSHTPINTNAPMNTNASMNTNAPMNIIVVPVLFKGSVRAVFELASSSPFSVTHRALIDELADSMGVVLNTIEAGTRTDNLLQKSLSLAQELRAQQDVLRRSNEDLGRQAALLATRNTEAEQKNLQVERSARLLEKKAAQLAVSSTHKSEFIAHMSHELRTPLNSLLLLAEHLESNPEHNMTAAQVEYASVIRSSGNDLLTLLNEVLDGAKVESGTVTIELAPSAIGPLGNALLREYRLVAKARGLGCSLEIAAECPEFIVTDSARLRQILKNLINNAFKFTQRGDIRITVRMVTSGWRRQVDSLTKAGAVVAFSVIDSGIGIEQAQQERIFEEFAQADGSIARRYGGTGLGLSISRALVHLLGGDITVTSQINRGSTFTVYLPAGWPPAATSTLRDGYPASETGVPSGTAYRSTILSSSNW